MLFGLKIVIGAKKSYFVPKKNYLRGKNIIDAKINAIKLYFVQKKMHFMHFLAKIVFWS
jgi:hypothetical protein